MKKSRIYVLLIVVSVFITSCIENDELDAKLVDEEIPNSEIFGEWMPVRDVRVCSSGNNEVIELPECSQRARLRYTNSEFSWIVYGGLTNATCENLFNYQGTYELIEHEGSLILRGENENGELNHYYTYVERPDRRTLRLGGLSSCDCDGTYERVIQYKEYTLVETIN